MRWEVSGRIVAVKQDFWCYCFQYLFKKARSIFVEFPSSFSQRFISVLMVQPYNSTDMTTASKNVHFVFFKKIGFLYLSIAFLYLSIAFDAFRTLTLFSVDEILLPRCVNWATNFRGL